MAHDPMRGDGGGRLSAHSEVQVKSRGGEKQNALTAKRLA